MVIQHMCMKSCQLYSYINWQCDQHKDVHNIILFHVVRTFSVHDALTVYDVLNVHSPHLVVIHVTVDMTHV